MSERVTQKMNESTKRLKEMFPDYPVEIRDYHSHTKVTGEAEDVHGFVQEVSVRFNTYELKDFRIKWYNYDEVGIHLYPDS